MSVLPEVPAAEHRRVPLYLGICGTLLAVTILLAGVAAGRGAPMLWFLTGCVLGAGAILLGLAAWAGQLGADWRRVGPYALGAGALMAVPIALAYTSVAHVGAGYVAFAHALPIMLTWVLARLMGLEGRSPRRLLAAALGLAGGALMAAAKFAGAPAGGGPWVAAASAIPLLLALGNVYRTRFWPPGAPPLLLAALMLLATGLLSLPVALLVDGRAAAGGVLAPGVWPLMLATIAGYAVQYIAYFRLQRAGGPLMLSLMGPLAGVIGPLGAVLLGEPLPAVFGPAALLTGCGVWLMLSGR